MSNHPFTSPEQWEKLKTGIVQLAKQEILTRFEKITAEVKQDGSLLTEADIEMQKKTKAFLFENWPEFSFLGEESNQEEQIKALQSNNGCWVLDPVDGTSNFASGIPVFTVSLALVVQGCVVMGLVYDPSRDEMFAARKGMGSELNAKQFKAQTPKQTLKQCIGLIDFKRLPEELAIKIIKDNPYASQRSIGSVALDWCWVAYGRGQLYCHGAQNIWDYAAGYLILNEAGGMSCTLDGKDVYVNIVEKRSAVAATTPELFKQWQNYLTKN
ncbi:inositol monophosphatase family protein [Hydrogenovibrio kuenenii]|uniref:inositol monophosphatase family protein n=1 Tax=Hydrogenovibrio kuenenii TaxID=63658 RepID=UPI000465D099|nr:inositol monophosphatase family protein [Hydrogenovibrio kuenenii]